MFDWAIEILLIIVGGKRVCPVCEREFWTRGRIGCLCEDEAS